MNLIGKNLAALFGSQVATWAVSLLMIIVVPHFLGDAQFGDLSSALSFVLFFSLISGFGAGRFVTKETARDTARVGPYVFNALLMKLPLILLLSALALVLARILGFPEEVRRLLPAVGLAMGIGVLNSTVVGGLQGEQRMRWPAMWAAVERYTYTGLVVAALVTHRGLVAVALAQAVAGTISLAANSVQLARVLRRSARIDLQIWKVLLIGGAPFLLWDIALTIYGSVDVAMLTLMTRDTVVGWYTLAYKLVSVPIFLPTLVLTALFPAFSVHSTGVGSGFVTLVNRALRMVLLVCIPMTAGIALLAGDLITVLRYPEGFVHAVPLIQILVLHIPVVSVTTILGGVLMVNDRQKQWVVVGCCAALLNPLLNLVAIPLTISLYGNGAIGASVVTVMTECFMLAGALYLRPRGVFDGVTARFALRCIAAALPMATVVALAGPLWLPWRVGLGATVYGMASLALGTLSLREIHRIGAQILRPARLNSAAPSS